MKKIPNSKEYYICEQGFVYKRDKKLKTNNLEYFDVNISYEDGTNKRQYVHRLVAMLYIPNPENKPQVNHIDGNKRNNAVVNLEWVTVKENVQHAFKIGLIATGCNHHAAKLTEQEVHEICRLLQEGWRVKDVSDKFSILRSTVSQIKTGKQFKYIGSQYVFPGRKRSLSTETVKWICFMLGEGKRHKEILSLYTGNNLTIGMIDTILHRHGYKDISKDFQF